MKGETRLQVATLAVDAALAEVDDPRHVVLIGNILAALGKRRLREISALEVELFLGSLETES